MLIISIATPDLTLVTICLSFLSFFISRVADVSHNQFMAEFLLKLQFDNLSFFLEHLTHLYIL